MCVLRASGVAFEPDVFLKGSTFTPCKVYRCGEPHTKPGGPLRAFSGINIRVSDAPLSDLPTQVVDAERFLAVHRDEINRLASAPGVEFLALDFPVAQLRDGEYLVPQFERFPASLVRLAGDLGLAIELSIYPCDDAQATALQVNLHAMTSLIWRRADARFVDSDVTTPPATLVAQREDRGSAALQWLPTSE